MDMTQENPALNPEYFSVPSSSNVFWTSTTDMFTISSSDYIIAWAVQQYTADDVMAGIAETDTESYNAHTAICVSWDQTRWDWSKFQSLKNRNLNQSFIKFVKRYNLYNKMISDIDGQKKS